MQTASNTPRASIQFGWVRRVYCYLLQRIANLIPFTRARDCDQLVHIQDLIKLELIQKVDSLVENNGNGQRSNTDVEISGPPSPI